MGRFVVVVIDSCARANARRGAYGDAGANTLGNCARKVGGSSYRIWQPGPR